ncbi:UNVERIFIED_CONTAM: Pentatricopeptide repeat-containing protein [Sesamum latifolium]|uniref:Pentatricopeptide repeat-containing protein n=1 Tax=Sesamum latifolium TaxID=2727402 RepID=A0AAW2Y546_9LAMI
MYAEAGRWDEADRIRKLMNLRSVKKNPGCSWVQTQDEIHGFITGERLFQSTIPLSEDATQTIRSCLNLHQGHVSLEVWNIMANSAFVIV